MSDPTLSAKLQKNQEYLAGIREWHAALAKGDDRDTTATVAKLIAFAEAEERDLIRRIERTKGGRT